MGYNISNMRSCKVRRAVDQTAIVSGAATAISFDTIDWNPNGLAVAASPTKITVDKEGLYEVNAGVVWAAGSTGVRTLQIQVNGTANKFPLQVNQAAPAAGTGIQFISGYIYLLNGDYVELIGTQTQTANLSITADATAKSPYMALALVHPVYDNTANSEAA